MEISDIKQKLTISEVVKYYGLKPDKHARLNCPFHEDSSPSMQLYYKTQTAYCFSSKCMTHGKSMDVIDFVMYQEGISKHQAILKAGEMLGIVTEQSKSIEDKRLQLDVKPIIDKEQMLQNMFTYFKNAV